MPAPEHRAINNVTVVGAGFIGPQIALQTALHGFPVCLVDISGEALDRASRAQAAELTSRAPHLTAEERKLILGRARTVNPGL